MGSFAQGTEVTVERSRAEIELLLVRYGAKSFIGGWDGNKAVIMFEAKGRRLRFDLPIPDPNEKRFARNKKGETTPQQRVKLCEAETRRRWRALALVIKAKLEGVTSGIETFEEAFLSHIVIPGGKTFAEWAIPELARAYENGKAMPPLLGGGETEVTEPPPLLGGPR